MTEFRRDRLRRVTLILWAALLGGLFLHFAARAISPLALTWDVGSIDRPGQLTVYNRVPLGGSYGMPLEIGDWDGDGNYDLALAPMQASSGPVDAPRPSGGVVHVYKGTGELSGVIDPGVDTPPSVTLWGARANDLLGVELFTADVNGDGLEDLIVGSQNHDGPRGDCTNCGAGYVIFGSAEFFAEEERIVDMAAPPDGVLTVYGNEPGGRLGIWVEAGDLDGDGFKDVLLGADQTPADGALAHRGMVLVIYGREQFPSVIDLGTDEGRDLPGLSRLFGRESEDHFGASIHSRDLNADGRDELIVGSALERLSAGIGREGGYPAHAQMGGDGPTNTRTQAGEANVIFGPRDGGRLPEFVDLAAPPPELEGRITFIYGSGPVEACAEEITTGDYNGDGFNDLVLGAIRGAYPRPNFDFGKAYVLYWGPGLEGVEIDLATVGDDGIVSPGVRVSTMAGLDRSDILGDTLSTGDFNHDGLDDLAVGIPHGDNEEAVNAGIVALVYGRESPWPASWIPQADEIPEDLHVAYVLGTDSSDLLSYSMEARDYDNDGYADVFPNAMWGDGDANAQRNTGEAYVVSGYALSGTTLRIESVSPAEGPAASSTVVRILGEGFTTREDMSLEVDGRPIEDFTVLSGSELELTMPPSTEAKPVELTVRTRYGAKSLPNAFTYVMPFIRGDGDGDGTVTIADALGILSYLFEGFSSLVCLDAADVNDDGALDISDALHALNFLFAGGPPPPPPYPEPGPDPTDDGLFCRAG